MAKLAKEEAAAMAKQLRSKKGARNPSKAQVARDKRRMMVTFLKSALNVNVQRLQKMNDKALEDLYNKEKKTLQGEGEEEEIDEAQIDHIRKDAELAQQVQEGLETVPAQKGIKRIKKKASKPAKRLKRTKDVEQEKEQVEEHHEETQKEGEGEQHIEAQPYGESSAATDVEGL